MAEVRALEGLDLPSLAAILQAAQRLTGIPALITDTENHILTGAGLQDLCMGFHRQQPEFLACCLDADRHLLEGARGNDLVLEHTCPNGLDNLAGRVAVDGEHVYTLVLGQFFFDDREVDREAMVGRARTAGLDEAAYRAALARVPRVGRARARDAMALLRGLVGLMARVGVQNRELESSERTLKSILTAAPVGVGVVRERVLQWVNDRILELTGYERAELVGRSARMLYASEAEFLRAGQVKYDQIRSGASFGSVDTVWVRRDGTLVDVHLQSSPLVPGDLGPGLAFTVQDVSARVRAEAERRRLEAQVQHSQKLESLGVLAGGVAHDFNNLLMVILGNADLALLELPPGARARANLDEIGRASRRAAEICRQLLAYAGRGRFVVARADLSALVREMGQLLHISMSKKATLRYELGTGLPPVEADATQLRQVVMNLITNASEALGDAGGEVTLRTGVRECDAAALHEALGALEGPEPEPGRYVFLEVSDTGCGMTPEVRRRIFDPFFSTKFTGRGLGLAAVLGIVRGHRGVLAVSTEPGRGSTFTVLLPAAEGVAEAPLAPTTPPSAWRGAGLVLVVDDEEPVRTLAALMLTRAGFRVLTAAGGREALALLRQRSGAPADERFVAVVLDLTMPDLSGDEVHEEIRRLERAPRVVLSSGYDEPEAVSRFQGRGLAGFIQKPYVYEQLVAVLRRALGDR